MSSGSSKRPKPAKPMGKKKWKRFLHLVNSVLGQSAARATREVLRAQTEAARADREAARAETEAARADRAEMSMLEWRKRAQAGEFALCLLKMKLSTWQSRGPESFANTVAVRREEIEEALRMVAEGRMSMAPEGRR